MFSSFVSFNLLRYFSNSSTSCSTGSTPDTTCFSRCQSDRQTSRSTRRGSGPREHPSGMSRSSSDATFGSSGTRPTTDWSSRPCRSGTSGTSSRRSRVSSDASMSTDSTSRYIGSPSDSSFCTGGPRSSSFAGTFVSFAANGSL